LHFYRNTGNKSHPAFTLESACDGPFQAITSCTGQPALVDINGDGCLDVLLGTSSLLAAYLNTGNATAPHYTSTPEAVLSGFDDNAQVFFAYAPFNAVYGTQNNGIASYHVNNSALILVSKTKGSSGEGLSSELVLMANQLPTCTLCGKAEGQGVCTKALPPVCSCGVTLGGAGSMASCNDCGDGYYQDPAKFALNCVPCKPGSTCANGHATSCPVGTFNTLARASAAGSCVPCAAGRVGKIIGEINPLCGGPCPPGHVCPPGTVTPVPCAAGSYCDGTSVFTCPAGYFCSANSTTPTACAAGTACPRGSAQPD
jgi:hypothetical protein